jgi:hypothetical protein
VLPEPVRSLLSTPVTTGGDQVTGAGGGLGTC